MKRRAFLQGIGVATAMPLAPALAAQGSPDAAPDPACLPRRAVFQQHAYFSFDGNGAAYTPPTANKCTVDYRASLSDEEFLRRHWFS